MLTTYVYTSLLTVSTYSKKDSLILTLPKISRSPISPQTTQRFLKWSLAQTVDNWQLLGLCEFITMHLTFWIVSFAFLSPSRASFANFRKVNLVEKSRPKKLRCHTKGEPVQYSLVSEHQSGCEPFLNHSLLFCCLQGHSGMPKILNMLKMEECEFSTSQLMSLFLKFWNEAAKLLGDLPCNTFTLQPLGCTLAYTQAQVKVEGIL